MNALDILKYGQQTVLKTLAEFPEREHSAQIAAFRDLLVREATVL